MKLINWTKEIHNWENYILTAIRKAATSMPKSKLILIVPIKFERFPIKRQYKYAIRILGRIAFVGSIITKRYTMQINSINTYVIEDKVNQTKPKLKKILDTIQTDTHSNLNILEELTENFILTPPTLTEILTTQLQKLLIIYDINKLNPFNDPDDTSWVHNERYIR
jgi:hypothetical protein|tara:strand:- start:251 stop:748 length:498 start_codon:yes stop_codon:yes gene_type:complete